MNSHKGENESTGDKDSIPRYIWIFLYPKVEGLLPLTIIGVYYRAVSDSESE